MKGLTLLMQNQLKTQINRTVVVEMIFGDLKHFVYSLFWCISALLLLFLCYFILFFPIFKNNICSFLIHRKYAKRKRSHKHTFAMHGKRQIKITRMKKNNTNSHSDSDSCSNHFFQFHNIIWIIWWNIW